jgi:hypothetical protein
MNTFKKNSNMSNFAEPHLAHWQVALSPPKPPKLDKEQNSLIRNTAFKKN